VVDRGQRVDVDARARPTVPAATAPPTAQSPAQMTIAVPKPGPSGPPVTDMSIPATTGSTATASRPAIRETALLMPDAVPTRFSGTDASTAEVSGTAVSVSPRPSTTTPGSTPTR
jgi:hypothetical protein